MYSTMRFSRLLSPDGEMLYACAPRAVLLSSSQSLLWVWKHLVTMTTIFYTYHSFYRKAKKKTAETTRCRSTIQHGLDNAHHWHFEGKYLLRELISSIDNSITNTAHSYKARKGPFNSISHWIINKQRVKISEMSNQNHLYFPNSLVVCIKVERI